MDEPNALYNQWRKTDGAEELYAAPLPEQLTRANLLHAEPITICEADGEGIVAYRVLRYLGDFSSWELVPSLEDVRAIRAENLWLLEGENLTNGLMPVLGTDHVGPWPEVYELTYGPDPDTQEPYRRYGAWVKSSSGEVKTCWYADHTQATRLHQAYLNQLEEKRQRSQAYQARREMTRPWDEAHIQCVTLLNDPVIADLGENYRLLAIRVLETWHAELVQSRRWTSAADFLAGAQIVNEASRELSIALEALKDSRRAIIREHGLVARLNDLLERNIPLCPLCFEPYQRDEAWLEQLLIQGEASLGFEGRDSVSWSADEDDPPNRVKDFFQARKLVPQFLTVLEADDPDDPYEGRRILLRHLEVAGVTVARFVGMLSSGGESPELKNRQQLIDEGYTAENVDRYLAYHLPNEYVSPVVLVDLAALALAPSDAPGKLVDDWADTMRQFHQVQRAEEEKRQAAAEEEVRQGKALKLQIRWDEGKGRWASWLKEGEHKTVWVLDDAVSKDFQPGVYFCRVVRTPPRVQTPTLTFHVVRPFLKATRRLKNLRSDVGYER